METPPLPCVHHALTAEEIRLYCQGDIDQKSIHPRKHNLPQVSEFIRQVRDGENRFDLNRFLVDHGGTIADYRSIANRYSRKQWRTRGLDGNGREGQVFPAFVVDNRIPNSPLVILAWCIGKKRGLSIDQVQCAPPVRLLNRVEPSSQERKSETGASIDTGSESFLSEPPNAESNGFPVDADGLARLGVHGLPELTREFLARFQGSLAMGEVIQDQLFFNGEGIPAEKIITNLYSENIEEYLPTCVLKSLSQLAPDKKDKPKVHLKDWEGLVLDRAGELILDVISTNYMATRAINPVIDELQKLALKNPQTLKAFPRRLDANVVAITSDKLIVLLKRRSRGLDISKGLWEITAGESLDFEKDFKSEFVIKNQKMIHPPLSATHRALYEPCELNLPREIVEHSEITFLALATEWSSFLVNLVAIARIPMTYHKIRSRFIPNTEHTHINSVPFTLESCMKLLKSGEHVMPGAPETKAKLCDFSRYAIWTAWQNEEFRRQAR